MGYTTTFHGCIEVAPPLNGPEMVYLREFARTRHCENPSGPYALAGPNPSRYSGADYNNPPQGQPGLWCQWVPNEDGTALEWNGAEKFYDSVAWMQYLIDTFLRPRAVLEVERAHPHPEWEYPEAFKHFTCNHTLNGTITAQGEAAEDQWTLIVEDNTVRERQGHPPFTGPPPGTVRIALTQEFDLPEAVLTEAGGGALGEVTAENVARHLSVNEVASVLASGGATETVRRATVYDGYGGEAALNLEDAPPAPGDSAGTAALGLGAFPDRGE